MFHGANTPSIYRLEGREKEATKEGKSHLGAPAKGGEEESSSTSIRPPSRAMGAPPPLAPWWVVDIILRIEVF